MYGTLEEILGAESLTRGEKVRCMMALRHRLVGEARAAVDAAEDRGNAMTREEQRTYDERMHKVREINLAIEERGGDPSGRNHDLRDYLGTEGQAPGQASAETGEEHALRADESTRDYLAARGALRGQEDYAGIGFARFVRAMVLGPRTDAERRALAEGTDSAGGFTVPSILAAELIDRLREAATVLRAGGRLVPLESDETTISRLLTDPLPAWRAENAGVAEVEPTFGRLVFKPKSLAFIVRASRELLEDSINLNEQLPLVFGRAMAAEIDRVALLGSGEDPEPLGVTETAGVAEVSMGTDGAELVNYDPLLDARQLILDANAPAPTAAIMAPRTGTTIAKFKDGNNQPLQRPPALSDLQFLETTKVAVDEVQGTAADASRIVLGGFASLWLGVRSEVMIEILRERYADNLQYGFLVHARYDTQLEHAAAFAQVTGIIPAP